MGNPFPTATQLGIGGFLAEGILEPAQFAFCGKSLKITGSSYRDISASIHLSYGLRHRSNGLEVLPVINIHGFANGGKTFPIGISQLIEVMEWMG